MGGQGIILGGMQAPYFTIIVPLTLNRSHLLPLTLDSLMTEQGPFEVIVVDGTLGAAFLNHLPLANTTYIRARKLNVFAMINQALPLAKGHYIHIVFPGEYYTWRKGLSFMMKMIQAYDFPDLIYTVRVTRHQFGQPTIDAHPLAMNDLKQGSLSSNLLSIWFHKETLLILGGFNEKYAIQGGFDTVCRYFLTPTLRKVFVRRILTDYEYRRPHSKWVIKASLEFLSISLVRFGPNRYLMNWLMRNCLRLFQFLWKIIRGSFWKRHTIYE